MRTVIRWLMINVLLLFSEEWENAQQEMREMQAVYKIQILCQTELKILRIELLEVEKLQIEAKQMTSRIPSAQPLIAEMLQERTQQLICTVSEQASQRRIIV